MTQSTSAELLVLGRQDTICAGAIRRFCEGAPVSNKPGTRHKSSRARASVERTARLASTNTTSPQPVAHVLLRYCAIAKLIANGSPYFVPHTVVRMKRSMGITLMEVTFESPIRSLADVAFTPVCN